MGQRSVTILGIALVICAIAAYAMTHRPAPSPDDSSNRISSNGTERSADARSALSSDEKIAAVREFYEDITAGNFESAYGRLAAGSFDSSNALADWYCGVAKIGPTETHDAGSAGLNVKIVATSRDGVATSYTGIITFTSDAATGRWLINRPSLTRAGPRLVGVPCVAATTAAAPDTPKPPVEKKSIDLADISNEVSYTLSGYQDNVLMLLSLDNESDTLWTVKIKKGTRLEPDDSSVQSMVVTQDVDVEIEPHEHKSLKLHVACLDIALAAPKPRNTGWKVSVVPRLADFIDCSGIEPTDIRLQGAIWVARGASPDDLAKQVHKSMPNSSDDDVARAATALKDEFQPFADRCGSLVSL